VNVLSLPDLLRVAEPLHSLSKDSIDFNDLCTSFEVVMKILIEVLY
jgi:hypothetical protein